MACEFLQSKYKNNFNLKIIDKEFSWIFTIITGDHFRPFLLNILKYESKANLKILKTCLGWTPQWLLLFIIFGAATEGLDDYGVLLNFYDFLFAGPVTPWKESC